jgi:hypothetical protein
MTVVIVVWSVRNGLLLTKQYGSKGKSMSIKLQRGLNFVDVNYGYRWQLEKPWTYKEREVMWTCKAVNKHPLQLEEKDWFIGDIAEGLEKQQ